VGCRETTTNLSGNGLLALLGNPNELERLRGNPELLPSAVEELLRYKPPSQQCARIAHRKIALGWH
jgi:cytochrome P450